MDRNLELTRKALEVPKFHTVRNRMIQALAVVLRKSWLAVCALQEPLRSLLAASEDRNGQAPEQAAASAKAALAVRGERGSQL